LLVVHLVVLTVAVVEEQVDFVQLLLLLAVEAV
jgi:hypothetical protein